MQYSGQVGAAAQFIGSRYILPAVGALMGFGTAARLMRRRGRRGGRYQPIVMRFKRRRTGPARKPEIKYCQTLASQPPAVGGDVLSINSTAEGTAYNQRDGRKIYGKYIQLDILFTPPSTAFLKDSYLVGLVYDKQSNAALPTTADIWDPDTLNIAYQFKNIKTNGERFRIVKSWRSCPFSTEDGQNQGRLSFYYKIPKIFSTVNYSAAGAGVPQSGAWFVSIVSAANTHNAATCFNYAMNARFAFTE